MQYPDATSIRSMSMFDRLSSQSDPYILYISTDACSVCKSVYPKMAELAKAHGIEVYTIDAGEQPSISGQLLVFSVPTIIVMANQKEVYRESRFIRFDQLEHIMGSIIGEAA